MPNQKPIDISQKILEKIKTGQVKMTPKIFFTLKTVSQRGFLAILLAVAMIILSLMVYLAKQPISAQFIGSSNSAFSSFLADFPFGWLLSAWLLVVIATYILRKYSLAYRQRFYRTLAPIAIVVILVGGALTFSGFHEGLAAKASEFDLGLLKSVYRQALSCDFNSEHLLIGRVISIDKENKTAKVIGVGHLSATIKWFSDTKIINAPKVGDIFGAAGYLENDIFYAQGIRKVELSALKNRCFNENKNPL